MRFSNDPRNHRTDRTDAGRAELERRVLQGLAAEWEAALDGLDPALRRGLRRPLFALRDLKSRWGYWASARREICLDRGLVRDHPWDAVREVLLHESAHQLAEEKLGGRGQPPHGPAFRRACRLLRANPEASGTFPLIDQRLTGGPDEPRDRIMRRVRKLLALAESANRHEAEAAMVKAHALIDRFNVERILAPRPRAFESAFLGRPALRHTRDRYHLAGLILDYYFVAGIWVPAFVLEKGKMGRVLEISGSVRNLRIAAYVHDFVTRYIENRWQAYRRRRGLTWHRRADFAVGVVEGFRSRLEDRRNSGSGGERTRALIATGDPQLTAYMGWRHPRTRSIRRQAARRDDGVLEDGLAVGKKMVISRGIESSDGDRGKRIGAG